MNATTTTLREAAEYTLSMLHQHIPTTTRGHLDGGTETVAERLAAIGGVCAERMLRDALAAARPSVEGGDR